MRNCGGITKELFEFLFMFATDLAPKTMPRVLGLGMKRTCSIGTPSVGFHYRPTSPEEVCCRCGRRTQLGPRKTARRCSVEMPRDTFRKSSGPVQSTTITVLCPTLFLATSSRTHLFYFRYPSRRKPLMLVLFRQTLNSFQCCSAIPKFRRTERLLIMCRNDKSGSCPTLSDGADEDLGEETDDEVSTPAQEREESRAHVKLARQPAAVFWRAFRNRRSEADGVAVVQFVGRKSTSVAHSARHDRCHMLRQQSRYPGYTVSKNFAVSTPRTSRTPMAEKISSRSHTSCVSPRTVTRSNGDATCPLKKHTRHPDASVWEKLTR